ncbi:histone-lysine N-methyltransferase SETDB2 isoform X4 [Microcebus murinus]|uniref:PHD finger protein 11 n=1 Tax=Microcebus murinus TaxID=30608 RepID=A0A8B7EE70_MICMU|nr:SETDB2-PHF11 protein isoform X2 [Microcebus murinus]
MARALPPGANCVPCAGSAETQLAQDRLPRPTAVAQLQDARWIHLAGSGLGEVPRGPPAQMEEGVFQVAEKMEKRTCALCPSGVDYSVLYFSQSENIAAHENCLLYSSALVECEDNNSQNLDRSFDVESVKKEIQRGRRLKCSFCRERGATVGCDVKACKRSYHFFCAKRDHTVLQADESQGIYKLLCQQHAPVSLNIPPSEAKRKRERKKGLQTDILIQAAETMKLNTYMRQVKEEPGRHTDAIVKAPFLKKCKEAGLLHDLFEEILDKLHLVQERLMDERTSESEYEEIGASLFDCRLFEDIFVHFEAAIQSKVHESEKRLQKLKKEIELLQDLKETLGSFQENRDLRSSSTSISSMSS